MSRDRDRILEQALTHELHAAGTPDRDSCVDAETLGAWADGGLDGAQMAAVEGHVSTCGRCQAIVGLVSRSAPVASGPEAAGSFFSWRWWLAPLAATAAAATLWMIAPAQRDIVVAPTSVAAPARETLARNGAKDRPIPIDPPPPKPAQEPPASGDRARRPNTPAKTRDDRGERLGDVSAKQEGGLAAKKPDAGARNLLQDKVAVAGAPAPAVATPSLLAAPELQKSARLSFAPVEIVSPDPSRRWRIVNGAIERSEDGGASWVGIRPPAGESITGGTAPARSICWLIGSSGLVLVTADGVTFARVPLPERVDVTAVTATDASSAVVTTADGRRFRTDDSGRNWRVN